MEARSRKDVVRRLALARRARLSLAARAAASAAIAGRLLALPEVAGARTLLAFASTAREVATDAILAAALRDGRVVLLPTVTGPGEMRAAPIRSLDDLAPGYRGIREPGRVEPADPAAADVAIVPGVAFDARGARLGHGGGFYDRLLAAIPRRVPRVGVAFEVQVVDEVPEEPDDQRVDVIVTEARVLDCRAGR
ncbi:MAG: 5-formyltetrahydrofolate cyclo-ligase [Acidobacteria bacterium]|nr:5-formyltetrahydrofolate cyclo-ligase [Acidobacteriota bacterium]